jgi:succinoglycan biosynthesis transport protein ExoP
MFSPAAKSGGDDRRPGGEQQLAPLGAGALPSARDPYGTPGYGYGHVPEIEGTDFAAMAMRHLRTVLKHKWLILGAVVLFVAIGGVATAMKTPLYTATAQIQIASQPTRVVDAGATTPSEYSAPDFLRTEYELLKSRAMAERVVSMTNLAEDKTFFAPRNPTLLSALGGLLRPAPSEPSAPATALEAWATGIVASNIAVRPVPGARLVNLSYTDPSPQRAERIANAYADAYIASNLDKRFQANAYARTFLDDQIKQLKIKLGESERALLEFAEREKLIEVNEETSIAASNLAAANSALGVLISERMRSEQSWEQVKGASEINLPQFLSNGVIDGLRARRNALVTEYEEKLETFKPNYPAMVQITNKIKEIDRQLAAEVARKTR